MVQRGLDLGLALDPGRHDLDVLALDGQTEPRHERLDLGVVAQAVADDQPDARAVSGDVVAGRPAYRSVGAAAGIRAHGAAQPCAAGRASCRAASTVGADVLPAP